MSDEPLPVTTISHVLPMSAEAHAEAQAIRGAFSRWLALTPGQRAVRGAVARSAARVQRVLVRRAAVPQALTLDVLLDRLDWAREYAEHLMQPYCECMPIGEDPYRCEFAVDAGLYPYGYDLDGTP